MGAPVTGRKRLAREDRHRQLLDVAADLVAADGVAALTLDRVAATAGVAAGLPYAYFRSVDDLLLALFDDVVGAVDGAIESLVAAHPPFDDLVRRSLGVWLDALRTRPRLVLALLGGRANPALAEHLRARDDRARQTWRRAATAAFGLAGPDADVLATVLTVSAPGVLELASRRGRRGGAGDAVETFVRLAVAAAEGLRA